MSAAKASVQEYLQKTKANEYIEEAMNELLKTKPEDTFGVLSTLLRKHALPPTVDHLVGREVLDSRGNPTVEVDVYANYLGHIQFAANSSAPSGASTGSGEAYELRDKDPKRYGGKGTLTAAGNVTNKISPALKGMPLADLKALDKKICDTDGTELKQNLGGNACTAASFALATAAAELNEEPLFIYLARNYYGAENMPKKYTLPSPFFNILNGGKHAGGNLKLQEFMVSPRKDVPFPDQLRMVAEVYQKLGALLSKKHGVSAKNLGDEGGFAPLLNTPEEAIQTIEEAIVEAGYKTGVDIFLGLDAASSEFYNAETGKYEVEVGMFKTGDEMIQYWKDLVARHPSIISIEDGLDEKDYAHWTKLNAELGGKIQLVGDDLYTTNPKTIKKGLEGKWCNALLLKVNQIGTISEGMEAAKLILDAGQRVMVSHRSGETCNSVIADLAVAIGAQSIKTGSTARGERIQKYTRLLQIYEYLKEHDMLA
ncbi:enolase family protein [Trichomonas vaginalis G3]|uniref:phosphopyruvate hydratase n=1 Tax=Trichomonas vaginalis (strain ATCC PRA-98 / G3) TaxID=412133 RepID=A2ELB9_TRIV3|nr:enolase family [Trichomonas vaginalis G3]EAY06521.1 enolase family protein [Trichomonas vaginalis G3]KAI5526090.1 enolase family [Trichomonas vaginalis G3]|eukprot:XP_001318744.1 enolase family protein [Trichomonas vaginalis G3]